MSGERRSFRREPEEKRREALILAALDLMAEEGPGATTVRAIAERAGITPGLIRHYFETKDALTRAAYRWMMERMTEESEAACRASDSPEAALAALVCATLRPPVMEGSRVRLWAGFLHMVHQDPAMRAEHEATYTQYRDLIQSQIQRLPGKADPAIARPLAIACNAVIDGLWLEGGTLPESFAEGEIAAIGLRSVSAILGLDLTRHPRPHPENGGQEGPAP